MMLTLERHPVATPFFCERCDADKKAKLIGSWKKDDGTTATICNGCYGWLKANG